jgi:hypothetical protein
METIPNAQLGVRVITGAIAMGVVGFVCDAHVPLSHAGDCGDFRSSDLGDRVHAMMIPRGVS